jgi:dolichol-phosphate mannosyltransferase
MAHRDSIKRSNEKIVAVIPSLNEEKGIGQTIRELNVALRRKNYNYKIVVVDGGSQDRTVAIAKDEGAIVLQQIDEGYGGALLTGFLYGLHVLHATILFVTDADMTYDCSNAGALIDPILDKRSDYVIGRRLPSKDAMGNVHAFGNWAITWMVARFLRTSVHDSQSGMFAFRSYLIRETDFHTKGWAVNTELLKRAAEMNMSIGEATVNYRKRIGEVKHSTISGGLANIAVILRMMRDAEPLLFFSLLAFVFIVLGAITGARVAIEWILTGTESHVGTAILSALSVIVGIQLLAFGLIADMIKQSRRKNRPANELVFHVL